MEGSSRPPSNYSRPYSLRDDEDLAVTQASFESLALTPSVGSQRYQGPLSSYQVPDPIYTQQHFGGADPSTVYFHPPYGSTNYPLGSPVSFAESPQGYSTVGVSSDPPIPPSANLHVTDSVSSEPHEMPVPGSDMSYQYMTSQMPGGHMGSQRFDPPSMQSYYTETQPRSMSDSYGHSFPQPLSFSSVGNEYREMARQRRRPSNETRRESKLRTRKNRLSSIAETRTSISQNLGSPVDFSPIAPPLSTSYGHGSTERSYRPPRQSTGSSSHGEYNVPSSSAPSYSERAPYPPVYHVPTVNPGGYVGPHQPLGGPMPPNISSMYGPPYPTRPRSPLPPPSPNPENPPRAVSPRLVDRRERPQCWEHGCNGREFSTFSNLLRHQREKSGTAAKSYCPNCHAEFTRTTARNGHMEHGKCKPRRTSDNP